jgi:hypothetical protein
MLDGRRPGTLREEDQIRIVYGVSGESLLGVVADSLAVARGVLGLLGLPGQCISEHRLVPPSRPRPRLRLVPGNPPETPRSIFDRRRTPKRPESPK